MPWPAIIGGAALLGGALIGGRSASNAARQEARNLEEAERRQYAYGNQARGRQMVNLFGRGGLDRYRTMMGPGDRPLFSTPESYRDELRTENVPGPRYNPRSRAGSEGGTRTWTERVTIPGQEGIFGATSDQEMQRYFDENPDAGLGIFGQMRQQNERFRREGDTQMFEFAGDTDRLNSLSDTNRRAVADLFSENAGRAGSMGRGIEDATNEWGRGRGEIIRQDSQREIENANAEATAALVRAGLGSSTVVANQTSANRARGNEGMQRALQSLSESQIDRSTAARRGTMQAVLEQMTRGADAQTRFRGADVDRNSQRAAARQALALELMARNQGAEANLLNTQLGVELSPIMNPGLDVNTAGFVPQNSGRGEVGQSIGLALGNIGGNAIGSWLQGSGGGYGGRGSGGGGGGGYGGGSPWDIDQSYGGGSTQFGSNRPR